MRRRKNHKMNIAVSLFTYNRSYHTEQVIIGLKNNTVPIQKLFVFQDGLKEGEDSDEWGKVNKLIRNIAWCDNEIVVSDVNKGLASSIVSGINYVFETYDAVIVLEDDCVPAPNFINFMEQCFEKYKEDRRVYSISGYAWPIGVKANQYAIYGCGRSSSWGWGTWKNRWEKYNADANVIKRLKSDRMKSQELAVWGNDLENMLIENLTCKNDSWAVYWSLNIIEAGGICINPYVSLIQNIGMDGTGVHCGKTNAFQVDMSYDINQKFNLPDEVVALEETKKAFVRLYGGYTGVNRSDDSKEKILVYGLGNFFDQNEKEINESYYIEAFIDNRKRGWFAGKKIITQNEIGLIYFDKILIMIKSISDCADIVKHLVKAEGIDSEKIMIGHNFYGECCKYVDEISVSPEGKLKIIIDEKIKDLVMINNIFI